MNETLALISGKGGSGKTTIALSLAQLLATCEKRVLLIDCDLSTHGATYFFESSFGNIEKYVVFSEIMSTGHDEIAEKTILNVRPNFDFIPSHLDFTSEGGFDTTAIDEKNFKLLIKLIELNNYDLVIFDCQAGYSYITKIVTGYTKRNLAVLEADAISASSLRVLYSQLAKNLDSSRTFQVFNKISSDEFEIYSKIPTGTLFNNLTPILFDWTVKKAFAYSQLPAIDDTNLPLTNTVVTLAIELLPSLRTSITDYSLKIKSKYLIKLSKEFDLQTDELKTEKKKHDSINNKIIKSVSFVFIATAITIASLFLTLQSAINSLFDETTIQLNAIISFLAVTLSFFMITSEKIYRKNWIKFDKDKFENLSKDNEELKCSIEKTKQEIESLRSEKF
jgi:cellulose biosynthesis protein BcsQ